MDNLKLYKKYRDLIKTGDLLQWRSNSLLGKAIRAKTSKDRRSYEVWAGINVNHSSLAIRMIEESTGDLRIFTTEALEKGTIPAFMSKRLEAYDGSVWWYPLKGEWDESRPVISRRAFDNLGVPYDYFAIAQQLLGFTPKQGGNALYCNEYCCVCWGIEQDTAHNPNWLPNLGIFKEPVRIK